MRQARARGTSATCLPHCCFPPCRPAQLLPEPTGLLPTKCLTMPQPRLCAGHAGEPSWMLCDQSLLQCCPSGVSGMLRVLAGLPLPPPGSGGSKRVPSLGPTPMPPSVPQPECGSKCRDQRGSQGARGRSWKGQRLLPPRSIPASQPQHQLEAPEALPTSWGPGPKQEGLRGEVAVDRQGDCRAR